MRIEKITLLIVLFVLSFSLFGSEPVVSIGVVMEPLTLDPALAMDNASLEAVHNLFDTLTVYNPATSRVEPSLAVSWRHSTDGKEWVLQLRKGVFFQDGTPFNSDAVVFSFQRHLDPRFPFGRVTNALFQEIFPSLREVKKLSEERVLFLFQEPFAPFLSALSFDGAAIVSPTAVKKYREKFGLNPVGTGPYRLKEWKKGMGVSLEAYGRYWRGKSPVGELKTVLEPRYGKMERLFREGALDMISSYSLSRLAALKGISWVRFADYPLFSVNFIAMNMEKAPLNKKGVRLALWHLWNPKTLTYTYQDTVLPITSMIPVGMEGHDSGLKGYSYSEKEAVKYLKREGYSKGITLKMILYQDDDLILQTCTLYGKGLKKAGITLKVQRLSIDDYTQALMKGDYDLTVSGWVSDYPDPDSIFTPLLSREIFQANAFANLSAVPMRAKLWERLQSARKEMDTVKRIKIYHDLAVIFQSEALAIPLFQDKAIWLYNRRVLFEERPPLGKLNYSSLRRQ